MQRLPAALLTLASIVCAAVTARADDRLRPTPPVTSRSAQSYFSWRYGEAERLQAIRRQLAANDLARWLAGLPGYGGYGPSREYVYSGAGSTPPHLNGLYGTVFEPWPSIPGDIFGTPNFDDVPQPLGHKIDFLGTNAYAYRPVYAPEPVAPVPAVPPAIARPVENVASPLPEGLVQVFRAGRFEEVIARLDATGASPEADLLQGHALLGLGQFARAAEAVHRGLKRLAPQRWDERSGEIVALWPDSETFGRALRGLEQYVADHPESGPGRFLLGYLYAGLGHPRQAAIQLEQAARLIPGDPTIAALLENLRRDQPPVAPPEGPEEF